MHALIITRRKHGSKLRQHRLFIHLLFIVSKDMLAYMGG
uniref:Uncharacterized protein n=1 Tax=Arundo donax TaxID=35708 RepID=A0A0A9GTG0_ARUDO